MAPLVLEPERLPRAVLEELRRTVREDLAETLEIAVRPRGVVRDPASLETARELLRAALAILDRPGPYDAKALGENVNLAYAAMLAAIDLVKSHTDVPRVPAPRSPGGPPPG